MYVVKFKHRNLLWEVSIIKKTWSSVMESHEVINMDRRAFVFRSSAKNWASRQICRKMIQEKQLEIIDG